MDYREICLELGAVKARISPERGALVTSLSVGEKSLLYMDQETLHDPARNVRGGIPILFPFCGNLLNQQVLATGAVIKQHGFARNQQWEVIDQSPASLHLRMPYTAEIAKVWPTRHRVDHKFLLTDRGIHLEMIVVNDGGEPMPLSPGWHPYFNCALADKALVESHLPETGPGHLHDHSEVNFGVPSPRDGAVVYTVPGLGKIRLVYSPEIRHLQIWSVPGKPFVCLEPFHGPPDTLNTSRALILKPNRGLSLWFRIELIE